MSKVQFLSSGSAQGFILQNAQEDVQHLLLNPPVDLKEHIKDLADQILSRRKAKDKLPNWLAKEAIVFPPPLSVEQSSSQAAAAYKSKLISGKNLIDLTGGMGVDCLALGQVFTHTTYVERDEWLCTLFQHNQDILTDKEITVVNATAEDFLKDFQGKATFFIDPARRDIHKNKVFRFSDCTPNLIEILPVFKEKADQVLVKAAPMIDLTQGITELGNVKQIHVLSIKNEVKEVLFLVDFKCKGEPEIHCVNLNEDQKTFRFLLSEEKEAPLTHDPIKKYLYDPNSSILKAGGFKSVAMQYPVQKLGASTHLYTSADLIGDFPGRRFEVIKAHLQKKDIKKLLPDGKANVLAKNYPLKPEELKKKFNLKDGGEFFLIGYRDTDKKPSLLVCKKK